ncbi:HK97 family phage prohead protease [Sphingomonas sp. 1P06PA]|uniref:HK97 family phage prohead protease n=1 Tax=Sphingomonas sp. 1P06PA TaxID=554121 RepID=UPI0039A64F01
MNEFDFPLDLKQIDADGTIVGLAAGYGNVDYGGDVLLPGSATKSLDGRKSLPMLLFHDQRRPVGVWTGFEETSDGLLSKGRFAMSTVDGREAHAMAKDGAYGGLSIGYRTLRDKLVGKARHLLEVALHEISLVTIPMNAKALITSVKGIEDARARLAAGDRLTEREFDAFFKALGLSNSEAERAVRINLKTGQGEPDGTANDEARAFLEALRV